MTPSPSTLATLAEDAAAHWKHELRDSLALIEAEIYDLKQRDFPGDRWRVAALLVQAEDRRAQLREVSRG